MLSNICVANANKSKHKWAILEKSPITHDATIRDSKKHLFTEWLRRRSRRSFTHESTESRLFKIAMYSDRLISYYAVYEIFIFLLNSNPIAVHLYDLEQYVSK